MGNNIQRKPPTHKAQTTYPTSIKFDPTIGWMNVKKMCLYSLNCHFDKLKISISFLPKKRKEIEGKNTIYLKDFSSCHI